MEIRDRIVVIEDDSSILNLLKTLLKANNYDVLVTASGESAAGRSYVSGMPSISSSNESHPSRLPATTTVC